MQMTYTEHEIEPLLAYQKASAGYVFPSLRLASVTLGEHPEIHFYVHGHPSLDDQESMSLIDTYFIVGFGSYVIQGPYDIFQIDAPAPITAYPGVCVYARKEEKLLVPHKPKVLVDPSVKTRWKIFFSVQQAMINNVFPEIRYVRARWNENSVCLIFVIDGELTASNQQCLKHIYKEFVAQISEIKDCKMEIIQVDFPKHVTEDYGGDLIYHRKEYSALHPKELYTHSGCVYPNKLKNWIYYYNLTTFSSQEPVLSI